MQTNLKYKKLYKQKTNFKNTKILTEMKTKI